MFHSDQANEIKTIAPRTVTLNLSEADCKRIAKLAGRSAITVNELLENFIGDLVEGTYSNGSDERDFAERWFQRTWMGDYSQECDNHLIRWLLCNSVDVEDFLDAWDEKQYADKHPEEYENDENWWTDILENVFDEEWGWIPNDHTNMENELKLCRQYINDLNKLLK